MKQPQNDYELNGIFPIPIYQAKRNSNLDSTEKKEIENIVENEGLQQNPSLSHDLRYQSNNTEIFDTKLKNLRKFCEQHIKIYVKEVINPENNEELDFYITQSWLILTNPGGRHHKHSHQNSIISGVFYIATVEDDRIFFHDPNTTAKGRIEFEIKEYNYFNSDSWVLPVENNKLILFPAWLEHGVEQNEKATTNRISLSFNVFVRGNIGSDIGITKLILR